MTEPPVVFDAVEFSQEFRTSDVVSELAFLAMELDFLHVPELGRELIKEYQARTNKQFPMHLFSFYQAYRATVRAKVHLLQTTPGRNDAKTHRALFHRYLHLAAAYASDFHHPVVVMMMGLSGVGKSTIARELSLRWGAEWIRTDQVRQELAERRDPDAPFGQGMYAADMTTKTYREAIHRTEQFIRAGISVVLDGTFLDPSHRDLVYSIAKEVSCNVLTVWCDCPKSLARERIVERERKQTDISDARLDIYERQLASFDSSSLFTDPQVVRVDTARPTDEVIEAIHSAIRQRVPS